jgi:hypothetical protein
MSSAEDDASGEDTASQSEHEPEVVLRRSPRGLPKLQVPADEGGSSKSKSNSKRKSKSRGKSRNRRESQSGSGSGSGRKGKKQKVTTDKDVLEVDDDEIDMTKIATKADLASAKDGGMLAPGWAPKMTEHQKAAAVYQHFYAFNLDLSYREPSRGFLEEEVHSKKGKNAKLESRGQIFVDGWFAYAAKAKSRMTTLICMGLGWPDHSSTNPWLNLRSSYDAICLLMPPPVDVYAEAQECVDNPFPSEDKVKEACDYHAFKRAEDHHALLTILQRKPTTNKKGKGAAYDAHNSLRRRPALFARFAVMAILACSGGDGMGHLQVALRRASSLLSGDSKFGESIACFLVVPLCSCVPF